MDRLLKYIRETSEKKIEIELEYAAMKTILETKLRHQFLKRNDQHKYSEDNDIEESTENLKVKLRELEKRRTQQALNYEEALLELESLKKNNHRQNIDLFRRNDTKDDLGWLLELMSNYSKEKNINNSSVSLTMEGMNVNKDLEKDLRESAILGSFDGSSKSNEEDPRYLSDLRNYGSSNIVSNNLEEAYKQSINLSMASKLDKQKKHIPAPIQITVENHPNHLNSKIIKWKSPDIIENLENFVISSYHFYVEGDFYKAIAVNELLQIILPNLDYETHRVSVRSVCAQGQSKDPQCTIEINPKKFAPSILKANKINGTSATVSWMPSNSNLPHVIWVNEMKFCICPPGVYKVFLHGLAANSLQKVRVHPILDKYQDESTSSTYLDFHTIPICNEIKSTTSNVSKDSLIEEIESPKDIKLKLGSRPGKFIIRWLCTPQPPLSMIKLIGYSILLNNQCLALVNGAKNDRFSLNLQDLKGISKPTNRSFLQMTEPPYLPLTVRTLGSIIETDGITDCTIQSKDSEPPLKFSGQVAAKIAGTAGEAAIMLGDDLAFFLNLITQPCNGDLTYAKSSWHSCYCLNNNNLQEEDSSFLPRSNFDWIENKATAYKSLSIHYLDQPRSENNSRSVSNDSVPDKVSDNMNKTNEIFDESCSSNSSTSLQENSQNVPYKSTYLRRKDIFDQTNGEIELSGNYLEVKNTSKNSQSIKNSPRDRSQAKLSVPKIQITKDSSFSEDDERYCKNKIKSRRNNDLYDDKVTSTAPPSKYLDYSSLPCQSTESNVNVKQNKEYRDNVRAPVYQKSSSQNNDIIKNTFDDRYYKDNQPLNEDVRYFVALYAYDPDTMSPNPNAINDELSFQTGQKIKIFGQVDEDGFYTGEINGRLGLIPSNMVKEIENINIKNKFKPLENPNDQYADRTKQRSNEPTLSRNVQPRSNNDQFNTDNHHNYPQNQYEQTTYEPHPMAHRKSNDSEVSYPISDPTLYQKSNETNHTQRQSSTGSVGPVLKGKRMMALYDYDPQVLSPNVDSDAELAFKANDVITILSEIDEDGFYIGERKGQRGLVPSNFLVEAIPLPNRLKNQQSFDGIQNQFQERNFSAGSNLSDPPPIRDHRYRNKQCNEEIEMAKNTQKMNYEKNYVGSHPIHKSDSKRIARHASLGHQNSINNGLRNSFTEHHQQQRPQPMDNQMSQRISKPINDRRTSHSKNNQPYPSTIKSHSRRHSPHNPLESEDMPIIMDIAPSKENQKKKKMISVPDTYQHNIPETSETYGQDDNFYENCNLPMSDNVENKQSVFKNSLKKKKP